MNKTFFKRIGAYILDVLIISSLVQLLSLVPFLNPNRTLYTEKYNELLNLQEQYNNSELSLDEYNQAFNPIAYEIYRLNTNYVITDLVCVLFYFGVLQYFLKGQTIGKKLFQIRVVSKDEKKLTMMNYILRTIVLSNAIISVALQCVVHFMSVDNYYNIYQNIDLVGSIILYIILFMACVRRDGRSLHDFVGGTKVVLENPDEKKEKIEEEQKIIELEAKETKTTKEKPNEKTKETQEKKKNAKKKDS